jgi:Family of unknown function (DUF6101)
MSAGGGQPAGSGRISRLDPLALPLRFRVADAGADGRERLVMLNGKSVLLLRFVRGVRISVSVPVSSFLGVAMRLVSSQRNASAVGVFLEHRDPELTVPLFAAVDATDVLAEWRLWGRVLGLPLLAPDADGCLSEAFSRIGGVRVSRPKARRSRHGTVARRRPRILLRRKGGSHRTNLVHKERELIAPD